MLLEQRDGRNRKMRRVHFLGEPLALPPLSYSLKNSLPIYQSFPAASLERGTRVRAVYVVSTREREIADDEEIVVARVVKVADTQ